MFGSKLLLIASTAVVLISGVFLSNNTSDDDQFHGDCEIIPIDGGAVGPESFAFDPLAGGGPYTGVSDGRIIKWEATERRWTDFAVTSPDRYECAESRDHEETEHICGRPLGLKFDDKTGNLYIADAYLGLLLVGPSGGIATKLSSKVQGLPIKFANAIDIDQTTGLVYFTHTSNSYSRRNYISIIVSGDKTGNLLKYDPESQQVIVLLNNLSFANGVALSQNGNFILVAETTNCRILRFWLKTSKAGTFDVFADLSGFPDNIRRNSNGEFWVAMYTKRSKFLKWILSKPWIGNVITKLPFDLAKVISYITKLRGQGLAVKLGVNGEILEKFEDRNGKSWRIASEVMERDGYLWIGSVVNPFLVKQKIYS